MDALIDKTNFLGLDEYTWLYSGAESPPLKAAVKAMQKYIENRTKGPEGRRENSYYEQKLRDNLGEMLKCKAEDIALLSNATEGINAVANSIHWEKGDNIVVNSLEFPSGVLPWLCLQKQGVELKVVEHSSWFVSSQSMLSKIDENTKLVAVSHVSFLSGARLDYKHIYEKLQNTNTLFLLDATQSLGLLPVEMDFADFIVCSSYKWLLSVHGLGILAVNPKRKGFMPKSAGWRSVADKFSPDRFSAFRYWDDMRRFELGFPSFPSIYATCASTSFLLEYNVSKIEEYILELGQEFIKQFKQLGLEVLTPVKKESRAGNIAVAIDDPEKIAKELENKGIFIWGGNGRIRVSIHAFNDSLDMSRFFTALKEYL